MRPFRILLTSFSFSTLADGLTAVLLPLMAAAASRSPLDVALVSVGRALPWTLLAPVVGVWVERVSVRTVLLWASACRMAVLGSLLLVLAASGPRIPALVVAAAALGVLEAFYEVAAQSSTPSMVGPDGLVAANAKLTATELIMRSFLGPSAAGVVAALSLLTVTGAGAALYGVTALVMLALPAIPAAASGPRRDIRGEVVEGMRFLRRDPLLVRFVAMTACSAVAYAGWMPVFTLYALAPGPVGLTGAGFGLAMSAASLGGLAATALTPRLPDRLAPMRVLTGTVVLGTLALAVPVVTARPVPNACALMVYSASVVTWNIITVSYRQRAAPAGMLGRINASYRALAWFLVPLGPLVSGLVGTLLGLRAALLLCAAVSGAALFFVPGTLRNAGALNRSAPRKDIHDLV
ncbi:MFS transporter [Streptomyces sp. NBC_00239]|uniref:MFS transporter n=1 Tax=Streptomyces sp. NBC_00239 TaxID=2903640 RepID=UPI002E2B8852|nr:MFS transporter [Streptomyces sp. NBC_00239]